MLGETMGKKDTFQDFKSNFKLEISKKIGFRLESFFYIHINLAQCTAQFCLTNYWISYYRIKSQSNFLKFFAPSNGLKMFDKQVS